MQKRASSAAGAPQEPQRRSRGAPQDMQKRASTGFSVEHAAQGVTGGLVTPQKSDRTYRRVLPIGCSKYSREGAGRVGSLGASIGNGLDGYMGYAPPNQRRSHQWHI
jgi:hypothetical protein